MSNAILLIEDDAIIASGLVYALQQEGYEVLHCSGISDGAAALREKGFDLAIVDMQLPDGIGFDIAPQLRDKSTALIFLTVVDDEGNIVRAFESGADDYITKPFRLRELLARVKRTLGSRKGGDGTGVGGSNGNNCGSAVLTLGDVSIDTASGKAYIGDRLLDLTALEYRLLLTFAQNKGRLLTRSQILEGIWDAAGNFVEDNTLTVYIKRLREKLGEAASIETVRGVGYRV